MCITFLGGRGKGSRKGPAASTTEHRCPVKLRPKGTITQLTPLDPPPYRELGLTQAQVAPRRAHCTSFIHLVNSPRHLFLARCVLIISDVKMNQPRSLHSVSSESWEEADIETGNNNSESLLLKCMSVKVRRVRQ